MYFTAGSVAAVLTACTASQMPMVEEPSPPSIDRVLPSRLCSPMVTFDMSIASTPDFGIDGVELPDATSAPRKPKPSMNMSTVTIRKPQMTAAVYLRKSFI